MEDIIKRLKCCKELFNVMGRTALPQGTKLYHYTTFQGLQGIVTSKSNLWMSHARFLNDDREIIESKELILKKLNEKDLIKMAGSLKNNPLEYYVSCFSKDADSLPQWINYANRGNGVCIEFEMPNTIQSDNTIDVLEVEYDSNNYCNRIDNFIRQFNNIKEQLNAFKDDTAALGAVAGSIIIGGFLGALGYLLYRSIKNNNNGNNNNGNNNNGNNNDDNNNSNDKITEILSKYYKDDSLTKEELSKLFSMLFWYIFPMMKVRDYSFEGEVRLVYYNINNALEKKYRVSKNNIIVPYIALNDINPNLKLNIASIVVGPTANYECVKESIAYFMENNGYENFKDKIKKSECHFRT